jgi:hypothetical protein
MDKHCIVVNVQSLSELNQLTDYLIQRGYTWRGVNSGIYGIYQKTLCLRILKNNPEVFYDKISYYEYHGHDIISFTEYMNGKTNLNKKLIAMAQSLLAKT